jgi:hypothetical protein
MKPLVLATALLVLAAPAQALEPIPFGDIRYGGPGCPDATATIVTNDARTSATLNLSSYSVGDGNRSLDRKACALAIPVSVPQNVQIAIRAVTIIGNVELPPGIEATLGVEAFVSGDIGETTDLTLTGPRSGSWQRTIVVAWDNLVWTGCGQDTNMRLNTSLRTKGNAGASVSVDAITLYRFAMRAC